MYLKYPMKVYLALIKCGLSQCLSVQCTSFQRVRNSGMKASSSRDFSSVQGQRCHEISYIKTPKQKLYMLTVSLHTRDLRVWPDSDKTAEKEEMRPRSGDWSKLHLDQEWSCSLSKCVSPAPLHALEHASSFCLVLLLTTCLEKQHEKALL